MKTRDRTKIWIDLENTPHVPFFLPIIRALERTGCEVILTARDFAQTKELVERAGLHAKIIGGEYGGSTVWKAFGIFSRAMSLVWYLKGKHISLAVGHGSRGLLLASKLLRIPSLTLYDYEGASVRLFNRQSTWVMTPQVIPMATLEHLGLAQSKHLTYPGLKEEVYAAEFTPDDSILTELGLDPSKILVTLRPPSSTAHYRSDESLRLFMEISKLLATRTNVQVVLMLRNADQRTDQNLIIHTSSFIIPTHALDGLNLLYHSDLVIGGGGTMNREAAVLGVPVISIFKGPEGAVDRWLIEQGKMVMVEHAEEILPFLMRRLHTNAISSSPTKTVIIDTILRLAAL